MSTETLPAAPDVRVTAKAVRDDRSPAGYVPPDALGAVVDVAARGEVEIRQFRPWYSGWCGPGPCRDGKQTNKAGEPIRRCLGEAVNGAKAPRQIVPCACACHRPQQ